MNRDELDEIAYAAEMLWLAAREQSTALRSKYNNWDKLHDHSSAALIGNSLFILQAFFDDFKEAIAKNAQ